MLNLEKSLAAFNEAKTLMPGGVNSPVRSYANVDCNPPFIAKAKGDRIFDIDGNEYIDYVGSWGPMIVGHAHPNVVKALQEAVTRGTSYGAPTLLESELAKLVMKVYPSIEVIRMVNSGTEATMSALRLARGYTGRDKIVKFIGCYHGHSDSLLVNAGSGMATFGVPSSPGVTKGTAADTISVPYNDVEAITKVMDEMGDEIAAVIIEPVAGNMGCVPPKQGYLRKIRELTQAHGTILIFDEATSALDNESEKVVQKSLELLAKDRTTFVIAHRLSTIRNAKRILVLTENGIAEEGTHKELLAKGGIYAHLYEMQF